MFRPSAIIEFREILSKSSTGVWVPATRRVGDYKLSLYGSSTLFLRIDGLACCFGGIANIFVNLLQLVAAMEVCAVKDRANNGLTLISMPEDKTSRLKYTLWKLKRKGSLSFSPVPSFSPMTVWRMEHQARWAASRTPEPEGRAWVRRHLSVATKHETLRLRQIAPAQQPN